MCQADIAVRIGLAAFGIGRSETYYGPLWSYGTPPSSPANPGMSVTAPGPVLLSALTTSHPSLVRSRAGNVGKTLRPKPIPAS